jgi:3-hydroxybutyrate dehydrogenase
VINMPSIYGMFATFNRLDYVTTKTVLIGLTGAVALARRARGSPAVRSTPALCRPAIDWRLRQGRQRDGTKLRTA